MKTNNSNNATKYKTSSKLSSTERLALLCSHDSQRNLEEMISKAEKNLKDLRSALKRHQDEMEAMKREIFTKHSLDPETSLLEYQIVEDQLLLLPTTKPTKGSQHEPQDPEPKGD